MKKILIEGMSGNPGGIETYIHLLYSEIRDSWQVDFLVEDPQIPFAEEFQAGGSQIHHFTHRCESVARFRRDIDRVFEEGRYDAFWFNRTTLSSAYSIISAKKHGVKKIIVHSHQSKNMGSFLTGILHRCNRARIGRCADVKAACSQVAAHWFFGKNIQDVVLIPNAVDTAVYAPDPELQKKAKQALGLEGKFVVGNVARFAPEKNHRQLLEIFEALHEKQENSHLILCGTGQLMDQTRQLVQQKHLEGAVSFLGKREDMPFVYQAMDVFVLPSLFEGLPFTLVEAQAAGIPCVVSDAVSREAGLTDIIHFLPLSDPSEVWAEKLLEYQNYEKVSKKAQLTEKGFTREAFAKTVQKILTGER